MYAYLHTEKKTQMVVTKRSHLVIGDGMMGNFHLLFLWLGAVEHRHRQTCI